MSDFGLTREALSLGKRGQTVSAARSGKGAVSAFACGLRADVAVSPYFLLMFKLCNQRAIGT